MYSISCRISNGIIHDIISRGAKFCLDSKRAIINCVVVDFVVSRFGQRDGCIFSFYTVILDNRILHVLTEHYACIRIVKYLVAIYGYIFAVQRAYYTYMAVIMYSIIAYHHIVSPCVWIDTIFDVIINVVIFDCDITYIF